MGNGIPISYYEQTVSRAECQFSALRQTSRACVLFQLKLLRDVLYCSFCPRTIAIGQFGQAVIHPAAIQNRRLHSRTNLSG